MCYFTAHTPIFYDSFNKICIFAQGHDNQQIPNKIPMATLKTTITALAITASLSCAAAATDQLVYNWGPADTIAHHKVGPGMTYAKIIFHEKPLILWWTEIDLSNPHAKVEQVESRHKVPDLSRWDVMTHYRENSRPGHRVKVAWNHDFFDYGGGVCIGLNISEGEMTRELYGRSTLAITTDGKAEVFRASFDAHVTTPDNTTVAIDYYNASYDGCRGDCILYNRFNSKTLAEEGRYISLRPLDSWIVNGHDTRCEVIEISDTPLQTSDNVYVLFLRGSKLNALDRHISPGDIITVSQSFHPTLWGNSPSQILNAFHGYVSIVHGGKLHDGEYNDFENGREYEKSCRVMAGVSKDKTRLYIATTELSASSIGVDCIELAAYMVEKGAWDVVNFDSGGSVAIVIDDKMLNIPGRGSVRPVKDAMLAVSLAPDDDNAHHLTFSRPYIAPSIASRVPLKVMAFNQYDVPLADDIRGCVFSCDPPELGYVDADGVFHASATPTAGHVIAEKDGMQATITVCTRPVEHIHPVHKPILIDNHRRVSLEIEGTSDGLAQKIDPGAFAWTTSVEGICAVDCDGVLSGLANGQTTLTGSLGDIRIEIDVTVEIPAGNTIDNKVFDNFDALEMQCPSAVKNAEILYSPLPDGWTSGAILNFDLAANRSANLTLNPNLTLYSLPEAITMGMLDKTGAARRITMQMVDATGTRRNLVADTRAGDNEYRFDFKTDSEEYPYYCYPLRLNKIQIGLQSAAMPGASIAFQSIKAHYRDAAGISSPSSENNGTLTVATDGEKIIISSDALDISNGQLSVFDIAGRLAASAAINDENGPGTLCADIKQLPAGIYFAVVSIGREKIGSVKFMVK